MSKNSNLAYKAYPKVDQFLPHLYPKDSGEHLTVLKQVNSLSWKVSECE